MAAGICLLKYNISTWNYGFTSLHFEKRQSRQTGLMFFGKQTKCGCVGVLNLNGFS